VATSVRTAVGRYNSAIRSAVQGKKVDLFDLADFMHQLKISGAPTESGFVTGTYGGGIYSEDGIYPSPTGQALVANAVLQFLNDKYGTNFVPISVVAGP
jgi:hypothetical protein